MQAALKLDDYGVLHSLFFNITDPNSAEPIARILGMVHLYRASGVHLLAFFTFLNFAIHKIGKGAGLRPEASKQLSLGFCGIAIFWIWSLQEFRLSLIRPIFLFLIRMFFENRGAKARILLPLLLTFFSEWLLSRDSSLSEGALHYYFSVAGGLLGYEIAKESSLGKKHLALAFGSWLPIALLQLGRDHIVSYLTPFYSLVSLPLISLLFYPLTLIDLAWHGEISPSTVQIWNVFLRFLFFIPDLGPRFSTVSHFAVLVSFPLACGFAWAWKKIKRPGIYLAMASVAFISVGRAAILAYTPQVKLAQIDVHQGDAAMMQVRRNETMRTEMIDVGSAKIYNISDWIAKLSRLGTPEIDGILLSHLDEDHVGALQEILMEVPVSCIETNQELWSTERGRRLHEWISEHAPRTKVTSADCIHLSKVAWFRSRKKSGNELMGGIVFPIDPHRAYFALGDGDESQELAYERYFRDSLQAYALRIFKISHHGSRFSSNAGFLNRMNASEYWISVGKHNPYHHPHPLTLAKLAGLPGKVYRTDEDGDVIRSFSE